MSDSVSAKNLENDTASAVQIVISGSQDTELRSIVKRPRISRSLRTAKEGGIDLCEAIEEMKRKAREDERIKFEKERAEYKEKAETDRRTIEKLMQENAVLLKKLQM